MTVTRVDYSDLVEALRYGDEETANKLLKEVMPRLSDYLEVVMNANPREAKECAQQAFLDVYERIRKDKIKEKKYIFSYLITTARNQYLHYKKHQHRFSSDPDDIYYQVEPAEQVESLIEEERMQVLESCLDQLDPHDKKLMIYMLANPDATTRQISKKFGLSGANVRTKKSRLTHRLHHCFKKKMPD